MDTPCKASIPTNTLGFHAGFLRILSVYEVLWWPGISTLRAKIMLSIIHYIHTKSTLSTLTVLWILHLFISWALNEVWVHERLHSWLSDWLLSGSNVNKCKICVQGLVSCDRHVLHLKCRLSVFGIHDKDHGPSGVSESIGMRTGMPQLTVINILYDALCRCEWMLHWIFKTVLKDSKAHFSKSEASELPEPATVDDMENMSSHANLDLSALEDQVRTKPNVYLDRTYAWIRDWVCDARVNVCVFSNVGPNGILMWTWVGVWDWMSQCSTMLLDRGEPWTCFGKRFWMSWDLVPV